uniref:Uncharacterized protein n=1 Tax=Parascaris univalens TaxID=6257 RepID=A0A915A5U4_PARUN
VLLAVHARRSEATTEMRLRRNCYQCGVSW